MVLQRLVLSDNVKFVAYADDVAVVIVAKHFGEINLAFDITFERVNQWMNKVKLQLAQHKTKAVLITSRKRAETITLGVVEHEITSQPFIQYLGVILDARLNSKQQVFMVRASLSLLSSVVMSVLTYGISVWAHTLGVQESRRKVASTYQLSALRVTSAFRTVAEEAVCVIAGMLPKQIAIVYVTVFEIYENPVRISLGELSFKTKLCRSCLTVFSTHFYLCRAVSFLRRRQVNQLEPCMQF